MKAKWKVPSVFKAAERKRVATGLRELAQAIPAEDSANPDLLRQQNAERAVGMAKAVNGD